MHTGLYVLHCSWRHCGYTQQTNSLTNAVEVPAGCDKSMCTTDVDPSFSR